MCGVVRRPLCCGPDAAVSIHETAGYDVTRVHNEEAGVAVFEFDAASTPALIVVAVSECKSDVVGSGGGKVHTKNTRGDIVGDHVDARQARIANVNAIRTGGDRTGPTEGDAVARSRVERLRAQDKGIGRGVGDIRLGIAHVEADSKWLRLV